MKLTKKEKLQSLPSVDELLRNPELASIVNSTSRKILLDAINTVLDRMRAEIINLDNPGSIRTFDTTVETIITKIAHETSLVRAKKLRKVINGTGIIIHTNLGRSILSEQAVKNLSEIGSSYSNLEYDLKSAKRGSRYAHVERIITLLTGAESAIVVNNNAAAVLICLDTLANGKEVVVSRGQLIEIGGSFRMPDIMKKSGAILKEVGTTNKTHLKDYEEAVSDNTGLLLKVHTSNYRIVGFTSEVPLDELVNLGRKFGLPVMEDLGSGNLLDLRNFGIHDEPTIKEVLGAGVDVVTFSGDKLLGGPQAGIIIGRKKYIEDIRRNPLNRAVRIDKLTLAALESTLREYLDEEKAVKRIPTLYQLTADLHSLSRKAKKLKRMLIKVRTEEHLEIEIVDDFSQAGGGSLPHLQLPTKVISIKSTVFGPEQLESFFRHSEPSIIGRIHDERFLLDVRTIYEYDFSHIANALTRILLTSQQK